MVSVKDLQDVVDDLKGEATKRANDLFGEGKSEVRRAVGGHSDGTIFGTLDRAQATQSRILALALGHELTDVPQTV